MSRGPSKRHSHSEGAEVEVERDTSGHGQPGPTEDDEPRPGLPRGRRTARPGRAGRGTTEPSAAGQPVAGTDAVAETESVDAEALDMARRVVDMAADKKASDIVLLDVRALTSVTDYFVICSGASDRQLGAIADGILEGLKEDGLRPLGREGGASAHWLLLDLGAVIVHVMSQSEREYYALEKLWSRAPLLLRVM